MNNRKEIDNQESQKIKEALMLPTDDLIALGEMAASIATANELTPFTKKTKFAKSNIAKSQSGVCMIGNIYTDERCPLCNGALDHSEDQQGFICRNDFSHGVFIPKNCRVKFGRSVSKRFRSYQEARQFLYGLRYKTVEKTFDARDYKKSNPMGFETQVEKYLPIKKRDVSIGQYRNIKRYLNNAAKTWGQRNVKTISFGDIEDYLYDLDVSDKTRANACSALHTFFQWLSNREEIPVPKFPKIDFDLGMRTIVSIDTQQDIIAEVKRISYHFNPRIWIGIRWLSTYIAFRPNELRQLRERDINVSGFFVLPPANTKERKPKLIAMLPEDIKLVESLPRSFGNQFFFRHLKGNGSAKRDSQFGKDYFYKWWKKACSNLSIEGVDLYGGTRHSTATALAEHFSEQEIMDAGTIHKSNKAARRYIQAKRNDSIQIYSKVREMQDVQIIKLEKKKAR
jgi:hypothetical protein